MSARLTENELPRGTSTAALTSVLFWCFLVCAIGLYAAVALAPKLWIHMKLVSEYRTNYAQIQALRERIEFLKKVADALKTDPEFRAEYARLDLVAERTDSERISVKEHLAWDTRRAEMLPCIRPAALPWYAPLVRQLAFNQGVRRVVLAAAALITVLSFGFLHESQRDRVLAARASVRSAWHALARRYRRT